jgi:hypothetical protein
MDATTTIQCLGADDAVGCWIMCEMVRAGVPGLYIWHRQEESGGVGSSYIADNHKDQLADIKAAIAFDRRGTTDVITHQSGGRCASDIFAESLAGQLPGAFRKSSGGIFTDTANYTDIIGECTNISVGYDGEHTSSESLDLAHALRVRNAMLDFDHTKLEYARLPGTGKHDWGDDGICHWGQYGGSGYSGYQGKEVWEDVDQNPRDPTEHGYSSYEQMTDMIRMNPAHVADLLESLGYDAAGLREELRDRGVSPHRL